MPTQFNSPAYKDDFPKVDAASIMVLRKAGALLLGKTTTTEFAATDAGPGTCNPHDLTRTPGGSSAGSGAAVGDFQVPVALGTQTGGSTVRPASYNGVYGFKPTWGAISREYQKIFSLTYDTLGFFTRGVEDLALLSEAFGLRDDEPSTFSSLQGSRFAVLRTMQWPAAGQGTVQALDRAVELLKASGATVEDVELPAEFDNLPKWYNIVLASEGASAFLPEYRAHRPALAPLLVNYVENKEGITHRQYLAALDGMSALRPKIDEIMSKYTAILTPSVTDEAPIGTSTGSYAFCKIWTGLHVPVVNIPGFQGTSGMPIGLSLISGRYHDRHLISVCEAVGPLFEREGGWKRPVHVHATNGHQPSKVVQSTTILNNHELAMNDQQGQYREFGLA